MNERRLRTRVVQMLETIGAFSVENRAHDGAPDICTTLGWLELKLATAPARRGVVHVDLRPAQRIWLRRWATFGGRAFVLTICSKGRGSRRLWVLSRGLWAAARLGNCDLDELTENAVANWVGAPTRMDLIQQLRGAVQRGEEEEE